LSCVDGPSKTGTNAMFNVCTLCRFVQSHSSGPRQMFFFFSQSAMFIRALGGGVRLHGVVHRSGRAMDEREPMRSLVAYAAASKLDGGDLSSMQRTRPLVFPSGLR